MKRGKILKNVHINEVTPGVIFKPDNMRDINNLLIPHFW